MSRLLGVCVWLARWPACSIGFGMRPEATGYRNIVLSGIMAGLSREEIEGYVPQIAEFCELGEYLNMPVRTYSNGMAMRLRFACGTAYSPEILLKDEWLGVGDPVFRKKAQAGMAALLEKAGILMLASHNNSSVRRNCNKALWLVRGVMRAFGAVEEVLEKFEHANRVGNREQPNQEGHESIPLAADAITELADESASQKPFASSNEQAPAVER